MKSFTLEGEEVGGGRWKLTLGDALPIFTYDPLGTAATLLKGKVCPPADLVIPSRDFRRLQEEGVTRHFTIAKEGVETPEWPPGSFLTVGPSRNRSPLILRAEVASVTLEQLDPSQLSAVWDWEERYGPGSARPRPVWIYVLKRKEADATEN